MSALIESRGFTIDGFELLEDWTVTPNTGVTQEFFDNGIDGFELLGNFTTTTESKVIQEFLDDWTTDWLTVDAPPVVISGGGGGLRNYYQQQKRKRLRIEQINNEFMLIVTAISKTIH